MDMEVVMHFPTLTYLYLIRNRSYEGFKRPNLGSMSQKLMKGIHSESTVLKRRETFTNMLIHLERQELILNKIFSIAYRSL
jgi:hypothetical protein